MEPLRLNSPLKDYIWGGTRLKTEFGKSTSLESKQFFNRKFRQELSFHSILNWFFFFQILSSLHNWLSILNIRT